MYPDWYHYATNCVIKGGIRQGKSKLAEDCARAHIEKGMGFCFIDWHGTSYQAMLDYLAYRQPKRQRIIRLDLSNPQHIVPWNPFALPKGHDPSAHVGRLVSLMTKLWGSKNANETPTLERVASMLFHYAALSGEPLQHAAKLLRFHNGHLRDRAVSAMPYDDMREEWEDLNAITNIRDWKNETLSTQNRIGRLIRSTGILRHIGLKGELLDISKAISEKAIILVNLKRSAHLNAEAARTFAALLLDEFLNIAVQNANANRPFWVCADEAQNYLTDDAADLLDQAMKSGLRLTLIHHYDGQFADRPKVLGAMDINAQIKAIFAGLPVPEAKRYAEEFFLPRINQTDVKRTLTGFQTVGHVEVPFEHRTSNESSSEGTSQTESESSMEIDTWSSSEGMSEFGKTIMCGSNEGYNSGWTTSSGRTSGQGRSSGKVQGTRPQPIIRELTSSVQDFTLEEKISRYAEEFLSLQPRQFILRLPQETSVTTVPEVTVYLLKPATRLKFEQTLTHGTIPAALADQIIIDQKKEFLGDDHDTHTRSRKPKTNRPLSRE